MKRLLLFAGLPGVGKSTISRGVSKKTGAEIVDIDDFKKTDVDPALVTSQIDPPELRWSYYQKALEHVFGLFEQGISTDEGLKMHLLFKEIFEEFSTCSQNHIVVTNENDSIMDLLVENILKRN